jgi:hypothetical protein
VKKVAKHCLIGMFRTNHDEIGLLLYIANCQLARVIIKGPLFPASFEIGVLYPSRTKSSVIGSRDYRHVR